MTHRVLPALILPALIWPALLLLAPVPAAAQTLPSADEVAAAVAQVPFDRCLDAEKAFRAQVDDLARSGAYSDYILRHATWSVELFCEAARYRDVEIPRLEADRDRLTALAAAAEARWAADHAVDPKAFPDYPGRDASQQLNLSDARRHLRNIESHRAESQRLLQLGRDNWAIILANDPKAAADLVRRLLGEIPQPLA